MQGRLSFAGSLRPATHMSLIRSRLVLRLLLLLPSVGRPLHAAPTTGSKVPGRTPTAIALNSSSGRVFTFNGGSANATAIDAATGQVVGSMALSGKPEFAVADGRGKMYVNIEDKSTLVRFDP